MSKIKPSYVYLLSAIGLILGWFYWFEYRPAKISEACSAYVAEASRNQGGDRDASWIKDWASVCTAVGGPKEFQESFDRGEKMKAESQAPDTVAEAE